MTRDAGLPRADIDTSLFDDPKVVALVRRLKDSFQIMVHVGLYQAVVLKSWRAGERLTLDEAAPAWWLEPTDEVRANLEVVGLLDAEGRIPEKAFESWYRPAEKRYAQRREAGSRGGRATARQRVDSPPSATPPATPSATAGEAATAATALAQPTVHPSSRPSSPPASANGSRPHERTTLRVPTEGDCRVCGGHATDKEAVRVGPGWIEHDEHPAAWATPGDLAAATLSPESPGLAAGAEPPAKPTRRKK